MPILQKILHFLPDGVTVAVLSDSEDCQAPVLHRREVLVRRIGALDEKDYESVTHALKKRYSTAPEQPFAYYQLTVGQLEQVWLDAFIQAGAQTETAACPRDIAKAVRALGGGVAKAQTIEATASLCDIVAVPETMTRLRTVCSLVRGWRRTWALYNTSGAIPYKSGVTALFFGPSGTGKTMAACAIANELGLELWRIDLSAVLDKYIGETEKHLAEVFATAKERNCILFFDEADALFSKRTEISSSHDRYANVETAFLLQCMEAYDGVILLATNLYQNFDEAFLRRISVVVRFSMPDGALRKELWQKAFSPAVRLQEGLNLSLLASELELSPAEICSAAQKAVALALELGDGMVTQSCLREALETELEKRGQISALRMLQTIFEE